MSGIPREFRRKTERDWIGDPEAWDAVTEFIEELPNHVVTGHGMFLRGLPGRGKTFLAAWIARAAVDAGLPTAFMSATAYLSLLKTRFEISQEHDALLKTRRDLQLDAGDDPGMDQRLLQITHERIRRNVQYEGLVNGVVKLLVLDDVGSERVTGWTSHEIETLLRIRPGPTVLTSNLSNEKLVTVYGEAFLSFTRGIADFIPVSGEDYRLSHATRAS